MLIENTIVNTDRFLEVFDDKFFNFCTKSPLTLKYKIYPTKVILYDLSTSDEPIPYSFDFDFSKSEGENIRTIKDFISEELYPVLTLVTKRSRSFSPQEIDKLMDQGVPYEKALSSKIEEETVVDYRIEKRIDQTNELILRNMSTNEVCLFVLRYPISIFLKEVYENPEKASIAFRDKAFFKKTLEETPFDKKVKVS